MGTAFCELIEHLPTDGLPKAGATDATLVITLDHHALMSGLGAAMLTTGTEISAGQARRLACNAHLIPAVLGGDSQILDFGTTRRLFSRTQRIALAVRDQECIFPGCDRPAHWAEAHHIDYASTGGPTNISNGCILCSWHHHLIHQDHWTIEMAEDGVPEAIPPPTIDPHQTPRRHERHRRRIPGESDLSFGRLRSPTALLLTRPATDRTHRLGPCAGRAARCQECPCTRTDPVRRPG